MTRRYVPLLAVALLLAGCDSLLDLNPPDELSGDVAINDAAGARSALIGAYSALTAGSYYSTDFVVLGDLSADNTEHTGTFESYDQADANGLLTNNGAVVGIWGDIYYGIGVTNHILEKVPGLGDLGEGERNQILGEARFLRGLHYFNLVRLWGDVPIVTSTIESPEQAAEVTRAPVAEVYAQILNDLQEAERLVTNTTQRTRASAGAVKALLAQVHLYRESWDLAQQKAEEVLGMNFSLAADYGDLFIDTDTPEDIFKVAFTIQDYNNFGYYFKTRREMRPTPDLAEAYEEGDVREAWSIDRDSQGRLVGNKFQTTQGAEDFHVIRLAEVVLIRAEALARQGQLADAVEAYNQVRDRAGLELHVLGEDVTTQEEVLQAIWNERRLELAFEGNRWHDLVRTGRAATVLGIHENMTLYPIPQRERDVAPNLTQNPGY